MINLLNLGVELLSKPIKIILIYLKNGNFLRGKIKKQTKKGAWLKILNGKGEVFIRNSEIEKVKKVK